MGANPRLKNLFDLLGHKANLRVTCPKCDRSAEFPTQMVIDYFRSAGLNTAWETAGRYFRCDGIGDTGCGHKGAWLEMVPIPEPRVVPKPQPTELQLRQEARRRRH